MMTVTDIIEVRMWLEFDFKSITIGGLRHCPELMIPADQRFQYTRELTARQQLCSATLCRDQSVQQSSLPGMGNA